MTIMDLIRWMIQTLRPWNGIRKRMLKLNLKRQLGNLKKIRRNQKLVRMEH